MPESVQHAINQQEALTNTGKYVVTKPTSPEQIHNETASSIASALNSAGHLSTQATVKADQTFQPTPQLKQSGVEPSGGEMSFKDVSRLVTEAIEGGEGTKGTVASKGKLPTAIDAFRRLKKGLMKKAA